MTFDEMYFDLGRLDRLSYGESPIHRLDPRTKVVATLLFLITVVSFPIYDVAGLLPFAFFPFLLASLGGIPARFILRKVLLVSPFALCVGIFNPLLDTRTVGVVAGLPVSAGLLSFLSILVKFVLTVSTTLLLIATTSFPGVCHALRRLGCPSLFISQLQFLYRYLFVLAEEAMRIVRARDLRSFGKRGTGAAVFVRLAGILLIRTLDRAERIYRAMLSRGFAGDIPTLRRSRLGAGDLWFVGGTAILLGAFRLLPVSEGVGRFVQGWFP